MNRGHVFSARVKREDDGLTVLAWHVLRFPHSTEEQWRARAEAGLLRRGSTSLATPAATGDEQDPVQDGSDSEGQVLAPYDIVREGDLLLYAREPWVEPAAPRDLRVLYEDEDLLALDKPAGLQVLPAGMFLESTLLRVVRAVPGWETWSPVHRLGRGTSGLQLGAKTQRGAESLTRQFREREVEKLYLALVEGAHALGSWVATQPIGRVPHEGLRIHALSANGKASRTRLRVLARDHGADRCLVAARPVTGRPDQIRIHLAASGNPIVGDPLYAAGGELNTGARPGDCGYLLRSVSLRFLHPTTGAPTLLRAPLPDWSR